MSDTLLDAFLATFKVDDTLVPCLYLSCAVVPGISSKVQITSLLVSRWILINSVGQELCLICVHHPKLSPAAISLASQRPLPRCPRLLSDLYYLILSIYSV